MRSDPPECCHRERHQSGAAPAAGYKASTGRPCAGPPLSSRPPLLESHSSLCGQPWAASCTPTASTVLSPPYIYTQDTAQPASIKVPQAVGSSPSPLVRRFAKPCSLLRPERASNYNLSTSNVFGRGWLTASQAMTSLSLLELLPACVTNHSSTAPI